MGRGGLTVTLVVVLAVLTVGCGDRRLDRAAGRFEPSTAGTLTVATADIPTPGFWEGRPGRLTGGFEYELSVHLRESFGLDELEVVVVPFATITSGDLGGADIALALITPTAPREEVLDFSDAYLRSPPALLTEADLEVPDLETARDLTYAVEDGTTLQTALEASIDPESEILVLDDQDAVVEALVAGAVDAAMLDLPAAAAIAERSGGKLAVGAKLGTDDTVAVALPQGDDSNTEATSSAIRALTSDGTLPELSDRWLGSEITEGAPDIPLLRTSR